MPLRALRNLYPGVTRIVIPINYHSLRSRSTLNLCPHIEVRNSATRFYPGGKTGNPVPVIRDQIWQHFDVT